MAIKREVILTINGSKASLDSKIFVYRNDRGIDLHIQLVNFSYLIETLTTPVRKASARVLKPDKLNYFDVDTLEVENDEIIFTITGSMTDELAEIGTYSVQIHLYDENGNRISIPPFDFFVRPLIADGEDKEEEVTYARADFAKADFNLAAPSDYVLDGKYVRVYWQTGDYVTSSKLNNIENGIEKNILKEAFTVRGKSYGDAVDGKVYSPGISALEIIKDMLTNRTLYQYKLPTMSFSSTVTSCEIGATISPTLKIDFVQNDSGGIASCSIAQDGTVISTSTQTSLVKAVMNRDREFVATVYYSAGPVKNDNLGDPSPGNIQEGMLSARLTIKALRPCFGFCDVSTEVPSVSYIRAKTPYKLGIARGGQIRVTTNADSNLVVFAYPLTLGECTKIRYEDLNDDNSKSIFSYTTLDIPDLSGLNPETYAVYYYIPLVPFGSKATFTLTI